MMCFVRRLTMTALLLALCAGACAAALLQVPSDARRLRDVQYGKVGDTPLLLDIVMPNDPPAKLHPAVVWIHGGGWKSGDKKMNAAALLVGQGYVGVSIEYRFSQAAVFPAQIYDCKAAIRFLRAHSNEYGIDPKRIGVWGASAGGHLAALLGVSGGVKKLEGDEGNPGVSSRVQAVCDFFGPTDLVKLAWTAPVANPITELLGGSVTEKTILARQASPMTYVNRGDSPTFIVHGEKDQLVSIDQSEMLYNALKKARVDATFLRVKNAGHGFDASTDPTMERIIDDVAKFFDRTLKTK